MASNSNARSSRYYGMRDTIVVVLQALAIALFVRVFFYQPFNIPSGSMKETLLVGDYLFVSKLSYGYSRFSFPFSPDLFSGRIFASEPERGDVAVFKLPRDNSTDYIKRVIGLPGDEIEDARRAALDQRHAGAEGGEGLDSRRWMTTGRSIEVPSFTGDAAERRHLHGARCAGERAVRQRRAVQGASRPLLHDGRQPRQLDRQPRAAGGGLRAV